jgi:hypothetical protein
LNGKLQQSGNQRSQKAFAHASLSGKTNTYRWNQTFQENN